MLPISLSNPGHGRILHAVFCFFARWNAFCLFFLETIRKCFLGRFSPISVPLSLLQTDLFHCKLCRWSLELFSKECIFWTRRYELREMRQWCIVNPRAFRNINIPEEALVWGNSPVWKQLFERSPVKSGVARIVLVGRHSQSIGSVYLIVLCILNFLLNTAHEGGGRYRTSKRSWYFLSSHNRCEQIGNKEIIWNGFWRYGRGCECYP